METTQRKETVLTAIIVFEDDNSARVSVVNEGTPAGGFAINAENGSTVRELLGYLGIIDILDGLDPADAEAIADRMVAAVVADPEVRDVTSTDETSASE